MGSSKLNVISIFDLSDKNIFGMKRYILDLLKEYDSSLISIKVIPQRGTRKLPLLFKTILNEIIIVGYFSFVSRLKNRRGLFFITSQHLGFA